MPIPYIGIPLEGAYYLTSSLQACDPCNTADDALTASSNTLWFVIARDHKFTYGCSCHIAIAGKRSTTTERRAQDISQRLETLFQMPFA